MRSLERRARKPSFVAFCGGLLAAAAIGLSAYAAHGVADPLVRANLGTAALYAFGHGAVLVVLGPVSLGALGRGGLYALLLGTLLFSGSLVAAALGGWPATLAPAGGMGLMAGWVLLAISALGRWGGRG